jgi:DNA-directed RNA polymerase subunit RPC12/RpoP
MLSSGGSGCDFGASGNWLTISEACLISIPSISTKYVVQFSWHLLGTLYHREIPTMFGQGLQYFCLECGNELVNKTLIDTGGCHSSQECPKCSYMLLFGTVKKKAKEGRYNG